jgi:hypothetical protein
MSDLSKVLNQQSLVAAFNAFKALTPEAVSAVQTVKTVSPSINLLTILTTFLPSSDVAELTAIEHEVEGAWTLFQSLGSVGAPILQELVTLATQLAAIAKTASSTPSTSSTAAA